MFKDQLARLSAANVRLALFRERRAMQIDSQIVAAFELWPEKDEWQHASWPSVIVLSPDYFASLQAHAVPLYENDLAALAHSALALDLYAWLAQRLHRIAPAQTGFHRMGRAQAAVRSRLRPHGPLQGEIPRRAAAGACPLRPGAVRPRRPRDHAASQPAAGDETPQVLLPPEAEHPNRPTICGKALG